MDKLQLIKNDISKAINVETLDESLKLRELGLDSLDVVEILVELESKYSIHFDEISMESLNTIGDLLNNIKKQL